MRIMEDKERFKEHIRNLVRKLQSTMLAQRFELRLEWDVELADGVPCRVFIDEPYWYCTIQISPHMYENEWKKGQWVDIGKYLVHEFCHTVIDPLYSEWIKPHECPANKEMITNAIERQTQLMCFILMGIIPDEEWTPETEEAESKEVETDGLSIRESEPTQRIGIPLGIIATSKE